MWLPFLCRLIGSIFCSFSMFLIFDKHTVLLRGGQGYLGGVGAKVGKRRQDVGERDY